MLEALLDKYRDEGIVGELDNVRLLRVAPFNSLDTPIELIERFGSRQAFEQAVQERQAALYQDSA